jgi:hypothetical protein
MDDAFGSKLSEDAFNKPVVAQIARPIAQFRAIPLSKSTKSAFHRADRDSAPRTHFIDPFAAEKNVRATDHMPAFYKMLR